MNVKRFWSKVSKGGPGECWTWTGGKFWDGYGWFLVDGKKRRAHRVSFFLANGHWPEPMCLHSCDNLVCVNPAHLSEGDQTDNMRDMAAKGRSGVRIGRENSKSKLTEAIVRSVRLRSKRDGTLVSQLAREHGVSWPTMNAAVKGRSWSHVK